MDDPHRFEFDESQNKTFSDLSQSMGVVGNLLIALGGLYVLAFIIAIIQAAKHLTTWGNVIAIGVALLLALTIGGWTLKASKAFGSIPLSSGNDIDYLMEALASLRKMYSLLSTAAIVFVALVILSLVASVAL